MLKFLKEQREKAKNFLNEQQAQRDLITEERTKITGMFAKRQTSYNTGGTKVVSGNGASSTSSAGYFNNPLTDRYHSDFQQETVSVTRAAKLNEEDEKKEPDKKHKKKHKKKSKKDKKKKKHKKKSKQESNQKNSSGSGSDSDTPASAAPSSNGSSSNDPLGLNGTF